MRAPVRYLLDNNVVSETRKLRPAARVQNFLNSADNQATFISVMTIGELRKGLMVKRRKHPSGTVDLARWVDALESNYSERILSVDQHVARKWGELCAERSRSVVYTLLAATAIVNNLVLVTRNVVDVADIEELQLFNPWEEEQSIF